MLLRAKLRNWEYYILGAAIPRLYNLRGYLNIFFANLSLKKPNPILKCFQPDTFPRYNSQDSLFALVIKLVRGSENFLSNICRDDQDVIVQLGLLH